MINTTINGKAVALSHKAGENLADCLRRHGYIEVRTGCDTGSCGLCTVWLDGVPVLSCSTLAARSEGKAITTIKGVASEAKALAAHLMKEGADQCGYCSPGFIMTALAMQRELENPSEAQIKHYLAGNLCRCTGYAGQTRGLMNWLKEEKSSANR